MNENVGTWQAELKINPKSDAAMTVTWQTYDGTALAGKDYVQAGGTLTIAAKSGSATVPITIINDAYNTGNRTFGLRITGVTGTGVTLDSPSDITVTIQEDDNNVPPAVAIAAPVINPAAGTFQQGITATATCATAGVTLRYRLDGAAPTATDPVLPVAGISVTQPGTFAVRGFLANSPPGPVSTAAYAFTVAPVTASLAAGTYTGTQTVTLSTATLGATILYTIDGSAPATSGVPATGPISVASNTTLRAVAIRTGWTSSALFSATYNIRVVAPVLTPATRTNLGPFTVQATVADPLAELRYTTGTVNPTATSPLWPAAGLLITTTTTVRVGAFRTGLTANIVAATFRPRVAAVTASLPAGTYIGTQTVTLSTTTAGASIYYTLDGTAPTTSSTLASGPITVSGSRTLRAIGALTGWSNSAGFRASYVLRVPTPSLNPVAAVQPSWPLVTAISADPLATIRYTTGTTTPTATSPIFPAAGLQLTQATTVNIVAVRTGWANSLVAKVSYTRNQPPAPSPLNLILDEDTTKAAVPVANDPDTAVLNWAVQTAPTLGSLTAFNPATGAFTYAPARDAVGSDPFTLRVTDGLSVVTLPVGITIRPVNDAPVAAAVSVATTEDTAVVVTPAASDVDGDALTWAIGGTAQHGTLGAIGATGAITYTPSANYAGADSFLLTVTDSIVTVQVPVSVTVTAVNDAPVAAAISVTTAEDTAVVVTPVASDADGDALTWAIGGTAQHGTLGAIGASGAITYTPSADYAGEDSFVLTVTDNLVTVQVPVSVTVTAVNDAPVAAAVSVTTVEDTAVVVTPAASDVDGDTLTWVIGSAPQHGTLGAIGADGAITYTPSADYAGADSFVLTVTDSIVTVQVTVSVTVTAVNDAPVAAAISVTTGEDTAVVVTPAASDADGDALTWAIGGTAQHGTLGAIGANGAITYTPSADYAGADSFVLTVTDNLVTVQVPVSVTVTAVNDAPVAAAVSVTTDEDTAVVVTPAASDTDGDALSWAIGSAPQHGTLGAIGADGAITYTPSADYAGADSFVLTVTDGVATVQVPVAVTVTAVNDAPVAAAVSVTTTEDTAVVVSPAASDVDGDSLTWAIASGPQHGSLGAIGADGAITYTPSADYVGADSFVLTVSDNTVTMQVPVAVTVTAVNDAPVLAAIEPAMTWFRDGDAGVAGTATMTVGDVDNTKLAGASVRIAANFQTGDSLLFSNQGGITGTWSSVSGTLTLSGSATLAVYQTALRSVRFTSSQAFPGTAARSIAYSVTDGLAVSNTVTRTVGVVTRSSAPWAESFEGIPAGTDLHQLELAGGTRWHGWNANPAATALVDGARARTGQAAVAISGTSDLVHEYKGVDTGGWRYSAWQFVPTTFTGTTYFILLNTYRDNGSDNWSTQMSFAFNGSSGVVHSDFDGAQTPLVRGRWVEVRVDIDLAADRQRFFYDGQQVLEKSWSGGVVGTGARNVAAVDLYANGTQAVYYDDLSLTRITPSISGGGAVTYVENAAPVAVVPAILVESFGVAQLDGAVVQITGNHQAGQDRLGATLQGGITAQWNDASGTLTLSGVATPAVYQAVLRSVAYDNRSEAPSAARRTLSVSVSAAGAVSNTVLATVDITPVNDAPVAQALTLSGAEDTVLSGQALATDVDSASLTWSVSAAAHGAAAVNAQTGVVTYTPGQDYTGADAFNLTVSDGQATATVTVSVTVTPVNDAPVPQALTLSGAEDTVLSGQAVAADVDSASLTWSVSTAAHGTAAVDTQTGVVTYTPAQDYTGTDAFDLAVSDGQATATVTVPVTVTPVNDAPVAQALTLTGAEDTVLSGQALADDVDGDSLTWSVSVAAHGTAAVDAQTGAVTYTPAQDYTGTDAFDLTVSDGQATAMVTVTVTVDPVDDPAVITVPGGGSAPLDSDLLLTGFTVSDIDSSIISLSLTVDAGTLALPQLGASGATLDAGVLSGSPTAVTAALAEVVWRAPSTAGSATLTLTGNGAAASVALSASDPSAPIVIAPLAATSWSSAPHGSEILPQPAHFWNIDVVTGGRYHLWLNGLAAAPVTLEIDGTTAGSIALATTAAWMCRDAAGVVQTLALSAGRHRLSLRGSAATVGQLILVAETPAGTSHEQPVLVGPGSVAVLDAGDYDAVEGRDGYAWLPAGVGAIRAVPDLELFDDRSNRNQTECLTYDIWFTASGTYRVWVRGSGPFTSDSINLVLDDGPVVTNLTKFGSNGGWSGSNDAGVATNVVVSSAGIHHLRIWAREDGTTIRQLAVSGVTAWAGLADQALPVAGRGGVYVPDSNGTLTVLATQPSYQLPSSTGYAWQIQTGSGGSYATALPDTGGGAPDTAAGRALTAQMTWHVRFDTAGQYRVWLRGAGPSGVSDSVFCGLDGNNSAIGGATYFPLGQPLTLGWTGTVTDRSSILLNVTTPGVRAFTVWMREDGVAIERIVVQPATLPAPTGTGPAPSSTVPVLPPANPG